MEEILRSLIETASKEKRIIILKSPVDPETSLRISPYGLLIFYLGREKHEFYPDELNNLPEIVRDILQGFLLTYKNDPQKLVVIYRPS